MSGQQLLTQLSGRRQKAGVMAASSRLTVGILGGLGPLASAQLYRIINEHTAVTRDQDYLDMIIYSRASTPDRTQLILEQREDELLADLLKACRVLEDAGAGLIAIACNTAHVVADALKAQLSVPFVDMVELTVASASALLQRHQRVAVLATDGTLFYGLYQDLLAQCGLEPYLLTEANQKRLMSIIYDYIKLNLAVPQELWSPIETELQQARLDLAILGCTELSLLDRDFALGSFYLDPLQVLARSLIESAQGIYIETATAGDGVGNS